MVAERKRELRYGFTTGACAAAASLGAARILKEQVAFKNQELELPTGMKACFELLGQEFTPEQASCYVIKDAGDDPDITHGVEVHARLRRLSEAGALHVLGGTGVGRVTKPGLAVAVGEPAINPVPMRMIREAVLSVFPEGGVEVEISIPDGVERAKKTLNERLGILGGLSILGTTGIVKPISHKAWTDSLEVSFDVAKAAGCETLILCTGRTSEEQAQQLLQLSEQASVMMGDHVRYALEACHRKGFGDILIAAQFAKLVKIACGHGQTHVSSSDLDLRDLAGFAREGGLDASQSEAIECANTAREVFERFSQSTPILDLTAARALKHLKNWAPGARIRILLAGYHGQLAGRFGDWPTQPTGEL